MSVFSSNVKDFSSLNEHKTLKIVYLLMIILYSARPTEQLSALEFYRSGAGDFIFFIIPIIMTALVLIKCRISFNKSSFWICLMIVSVWLLIQLVDKGALNLTLSLYYYYQFFLCYIVIQLFGNNLLEKYENIVYKLVVFSLICWGISVVLPSAMASFMHLFNNGTTISEGSFFFYTMLRLDKVNVLIRNAGFAWEPGRFSCYINLSLYICLLKNGFSIRDRRIWVYLFALLSTQSTTGIISFFIICFAFIANKKPTMKFVSLLFIIPVCYYLYNLDFAGEKLQTSIERGMNAESVLGGEYHSLDRMECIALDWINFKEDPVIGYGEKRYSVIGEDFSFPGMLVGTFAKYGIIMALLFFACVIKSSKYMASIYNDKFPLTCFLLFCLFSISYSFTNNVLFMAFNYLAVFGNNYAKEIVTD